jgi:hypothetical protein
VINLRPATSRSGWQKTTRFFKEKRHGSQAVFDSPARVVGSFVNIDLIAATTNALNGALLAQRPTIIGAGSEI